MMKIFLVVFMLLGTQALADPPTALQWHMVENTDSFSGRMEKSVAANFAAPRGEMIDVVGACRDQSGALSITITVTGPGFGFDSNGYDQRHAASWRYRINHGPPRSLTPIWVHANVVEIPYLAGYIADTTEEELRAASSFLVELPINNGDRLAVEFNPREPVFQAAARCFQAPQGPPGRKADESAK